MNKNKRSKYTKITVDGTQWWEHRYIWTKHNGPIPGDMQVHHINGKHSDNRIENLKLVTPKENTQQSDMWGMGFTKSTNTNLARPYGARRRMNDGKRHSLGWYGTPGGAYVAFRMAYVKHT